MFGERFSFVALGIIIGIGAALFHVTAVAYFGGTLSRSDIQQSRPQDCGDLYKCNGRNEPIDGFGQPLGDDEIRYLEAAEQPGHPDYHESQDLHAQRRMAAATDAIVKLSYASLVLGLVGAGAVIWTLRESQTANRIAAETAESQLRAYVVLSDVTYEDFAKVGGGTTNIRVYATWKNAGSTPAKSVRCSINHLCCSTLPDDFDFPPSEIEHLATIGPGVGTNDVSILLDGAIIDTEIFAGKRLFIWGWIEYSDVFVGTPRRRSEFCISTDVTDHGGNDRTYRNHTETRHNGNDEDCLKPPMTTA